MDIPLQPLGKKDIQRLETFLLIATLFRPDVLEKVRNAEDRITWIDSLAVAAGAIAREKAGKSVVEIAEELGRTEATIRKHLKGETEAGKLVRETYEMLARGMLEPDVMKIVERAFESEEVKKLKEKLERIKEKIEEIKKIIEE